MMSNILLVMTGGGLGAACRYLLTIGAIRLFGEEFPLGTLTVNLVGCFLIGLAFAYVRRDLVPPQFQLLLLTGFLGGLTTFSTYVLESATFWTGNAGWTTFANIGANNLGGLLLVFIGLWLGKQF
jgi:CrcB protein